MITTYLTLVAMLSLVLTPVLIPALIGAVHVVGRRGRSQSSPSAAERIMAAARIAVPAAA
jgi:hypothetical protein